MYSEERKNFINRLIKKEKKVTVLDLAKRLNVSQVTIRKDLSEMEEKGLLKRTFGGAIDLELSISDKPYSIKKGELIEQKERIAHRAALFVNDNSTIFLDAGTTVKCLIPYISEIKGLFIVTVDLNTAILLLDAGLENVYFVGGSLSQKTYSSSSVDTVEKIRKFNFDLSFIGCDSISRLGFQTGSEARSQLKSNAIKNSSLNIVLADSSKFEKSTFINFSDFLDIDYVITDDDLGDFAHEIPKEFVNKFLIV